MIRFHRTHPLRPFFTVAPALQQASQPVVAPAVKPAIAATPAPQPTATEATAQKTAAPTRSFGKINMGMTSLLNRPQTVTSQPGPASKTAATPHEAEAPRQLDKEKFGAAWIGFKEQIPDRARLHFHFESLPEVDDHLVRLNVNSPLFFEDMCDLQPKLQSYLQQRLSDHQIKVEVKLVELENQGRMLTDKEKILAMAEKNESVKSLCKRLDLRFE